MKELLLISVFIGNLATTSYRSVPAQTKPTGYDWTASGEHCHVRGIAVSQDLLKKNGGNLEYGDLVYIDQIGFKFVTDCMNKRHKNAIDIWVSSYQNEKAFHKKFGGKKLKVWKIIKGDNYEVR